LRKRYFAVQNRLEAQDILHVNYGFLYGFYAPGPDFDMLTKWDETLTLRPISFRVYGYVMRLFWPLKNAEAFFAKDP